MLYNLCLYNKYNRERRHLNITSGIATILKTRMRRELIEKFLYRYLYRHSNVCNGMTIQNQILQKPEMNDAYGFFWQFSRQLQKNMGTIFRRL